MRVTVLTLMSSKMLYCIIWLLDTSVSEKSVTSHQKVNEYSSFLCNILLDSLCSYKTALLRIS